MRDSVITSRVCVLLVVLSCLGACGPLEADEGDEPSAAPVEVRHEVEPARLPAPEEDASPEVRRLVVSFDEVGRTPEVSLEPADGEALIVRAMGADDLCFMREEGGAPARRAALDVVESSTRVARFQRLRCHTGTPLRQAAAEALTLEITTRAPSILPKGGIKVRFVLTEHARFSAAVFDEVLVALGEELDRAELSLDEVHLVEVEGAPEVTRFSDLENASLDALLALAPAGEPDMIDVVIAGCLRRVDARGVSQGVEGYTGRVSGGGRGGADAVYLPGLRCDALASGRPVERSAQATAHLMMHELGHYLGLTHSEELDNLMSPQPSRSSARALTRAQRALLRRHPLVR